MTLNKILLVVHFSLTTETRTVFISHITEGGSCKEIKLVI